MVYEASSWRLLITRIFALLSTNNQKGIKTSHSATGIRVRMLPPKLYLTKRKISGE